MLMLGQFMLPLLLFHVAFIQITDASTLSGGET